MTMNYGGSRDEDETLVEAGKRTLEAVHGQVREAYRANGETLDGREAWARIGMTPMIGQNDVVEEVLSLGAARSLNQWAREKGVGRISAWSLNRDQECGVNYLNLSAVSDACSGVEQGDVRFADVFSADLDADGEATASPPPTASPSPSATEPAGTEDDPATSPYAIWEPEAVYIAGTKVVWHRVVYVAKWWTSGETPDDPSLTEWETPWRMLGPVLPGETPVAAPTLPRGTFGAWNPEKVYTKGDRVLLDGVPYRARWWNLGESPEVATTNPDVSAWRAYTATEVRRLKKAAS
jgi:chitinase